MDRTDYHQRRVEFLLPLSMTCRMMRLRLLPWIWECVEVFSDDWTGGEGLMRRPRAIVGALRADPGLGESVKYFHFPSCHGPGLICILWRFLTTHLTYEFTAPLFVECLGSLPNLHTLEIPWVDMRIASPLENALKRVELPQIKTLIIPPATHPLLRHCHGVEDFVCVVRYTHTPTPSDRILSSLASNPDSRIKRLAIPLVLWANPSRK